MSISDVGRPRSAGAGSGSVAGPAAGLHLDIIEQGGDWAGFGAVHETVNAAGAALAAHPLCRDAQGSEASIVLANDALLRALNRTYRGKDSSTNVLSFPSQLPPGAKESSYLGDVILAAETLRREAAEQGIPCAHHLQHLVIHGLLHLLGFDHVIATGAEDMESVEAEVLGALGIANPYAGDQAV
jgi:probable rRNA maturation factor